MPEAEPNGNSKEPREYAYHGKRCAGAHVLVKLMHLSRWCVRHLCECFCARMSWATFVLVVLQNTVSVFLFIGRQWL